jgi:hypothetical protein
MPHFHISSTSPLPPPTPHIVSHRRPCPVLSHPPLHTPHGLANPSTSPLRYGRARLGRLITNDALKDLTGKASCEVELFENERWVPGEGTGWNKTNLKTGERVAWTRGRDGWSAVIAYGAGNIRSVVASSGSDNNSSNLTFPLEPNWLFFETEDWRADIAAEWSQSWCG